MTESIAAGDTPETTARMVSIVVPALDEQDNIESLYDALVPILERENVGWELIYCDDGSRDQTWQRVSELSARDERVSGIRLSRNFGHQYAILAGLNVARGDAVITMDADHQHPPELIADLLRSWRSGNKIVHAVRIDTHSTGLFKRLSSRLFYKLYSFLSGVTVDPGMADFRLLDRRVVDDLLRFREDGLFLRGLVQWVGYPSEKIPFRVGQRRSGSSKYTLPMMVRLAWAAVTSFSIVPLRVGIFVGLVTALIAFGGMIYATWAYFANKVVPGWASAVSITSFLFGVLFILIGVIGEYLGRVLTEVKGRPRFLISESVGQIRESGEPHDRREDR